MKNSSGRRAPMQRLPGRGMGGSAYPIGTRIAEGYGMDLGLEAREGRPADRLGMPPAVNAHRRRSLWWIYILVALVVIALLEASRIREIRIQAQSAPATEASWPDVRSAIAAGAYASGWLPAFVPPDATSLHEWHDTKTGESWLAFSCLREEALELGRRFEPMHAPAFGRSPTFDWWPSELRSQKARPDMSGWKFVLTNRVFRRGELEIIALDPSRRHVYVWRTITNRN